MTRIEFDKLAAAAESEADANIDENLDRVSAIESVLHLPPQQPTSADADTGVSGDHFSMSVHTAKGERRLREKLEREGYPVPPELEDDAMSPSEKRAVDAERRAAWRKARLKSLENVSLVPAS